jgi:Protein of unknown function (DUF2806)
MKLQGEMPAGPLRESPIDSGELSGPACVLAQKIFHAVGTLDQPARTAREPRLEAHANKIKALARTEWSQLSALEQRALERLVYQESRKQQNIEQITALALRSLPQDAGVADLADDWVAHFFKQCDSVSDSEMQSLWSRLLVREATRPGTLSKRTVDSVASIDNKDVKLFTALCQHTWLVGDLVPLIYDFNHEIYTHNGVTFETLKHLDAIGLISFEAFTTYTKRGIGKRGLVHYYGRSTFLEFPAERNNEFSVGHALFTLVGQELAPICGSTPSDDFYDYVLRWWKNKGITATSHHPGRRSPG